MKLEQAVHELVRRGFRRTFGQPAVKAESDSEWAKIRATGTRLWLDTGDIAEAEKLWVTEFEALTTNNTLLNKEVQKGIYDELVREAAAVVRRASPGISAQDLVLEIAFVLNACHALRLVEKFDARVSVELHTDLAGDVAHTVAYGKRYFAICPERFYVKVPFTPAGLLGARQLRLAGVPLNFTLGFSARQNYLAALLTQPQYVNVFMGRLNSFVADNKLGSGENVGERATLATQREINALRDRTPTRLIGASVRTGQQVADCAGVDVLTMPTKAAAEFRAKPPATVRSRVADTLDVPLAAGVTLDQFDGASLWDVPEKFRGAVAKLLAGNLDALTPEIVQAHFAAANLPGFLPRWSDSDIALATKDGKIPVLAHWQSRLRDGSVGLDALMNLSALQSFVTDQRALDARVKSLV